MILVPIPNLRCPLQSCQRFRYGLSHRRVIHLAVLVVKCSLLRDHDSIVTIIKNGRIFFCVLVWAVLLIVNVQTTSLPCSTLFQGSDILTLFLFAFLVIFYLLIESLLGLLCIDILRFSPCCRRRVQLVVIRTLCDSSILSKYWKRSSIRKHLVGVIHFDCWRCRSFSWCHPFRIIPTRCSSSRYQSCKYCRSLRWG